MSRIHEALVRARAMRLPEGNLSPDLTVGHDVAVLPTTPAEWVPEQSLPPQQSLPPRPTPRPSIVEATALPAESHALDSAKAWVFSPALLEKLVIGASVDQGALEQYRRLAGVLHLAQSERAAERPKIVMVSSALSSEGKTLTCVNLALTLSESYHRSVLLVDGDLRRPWLHEVFQVPNVGGLNDSLTSAEGKIPVRQISERLSLLTAGRPTADPMRVLASVRMENVLKQARSRYDWVLLDTPPVTLLTDASLLASKADLVVMVVQAEKTSFEVVQRAVDAVGRERVIGIVLNRIRATPPSVYAQQEKQNPDGFESTHAKEN